MRAVSYAELSEHDAPDAAWIAVRGKVYDLTKFRQFHPGGTLMLDPYLGTDVTEIYELLHDASVLQKYGDKFLVGALENSEFGGERPADPDRTFHPPEDLKLVGSSEESWFSGGTAHLLPEERKLASFDVREMTKCVYGGADKVERRRFILKPGQKFATVGFQKHEMSRERLLADSVTDFIDIHKPFTNTGYRPSREEVSWMNAMSVNTGSMMPHMGLFVPTILGQAADAQIMEWLPKALQFEIVGTYAQTELSHGSATRALRTVAEWSDEEKCFILNTPTLGAMKWWNSNAGVCSTHAAVYAQLIHRGKQKGLHVFMVQLRDENHALLPGIEAGDVGRKLGDNAIDTGYIRFKDVRVPREHLFCKRQRVTKKGDYERVAPETQDPKRAAAAKRAHYLTMMGARAGMVAIAGGKLMIAATIAVRYSIVRRQGFKEGTDNGDYKAAENKVLDYGNQLKRLMKVTATAYAFQASGLWLANTFEALSTESTKVDGDLSALPEIHASAAGLKGMCCSVACDLIEDARRATGGHGYLQSAGLAPLFADFVWQSTAEGDTVVLLLQTARYLVKMYNAAKRGEPLEGLTECLKPFRDPKFDPLRQAKPPTPPTLDGFLELPHLLSLFEFRTLFQVQRAGEKVLKSGFQHNAVDLVATARSHVYFFILRNFVERNRDAGQDAHCVRALDDLARYFALCELSDGQQWSGLLNVQEAEYVSEGLSRVGAALRPDALALVDAFDVPEHVLNSTLGRADGNVYEALYEAAYFAPMNVQTRARNGKFEGYEKLEKHLDKDYLAMRGKASDLLKSML